jgi:hypothetical protein
MPSQKKAPKLDPKKTKDFVKGFTSGEDPIVSAFKNFFKDKDKAKAKK